MNPKKQNPNSQPALPESRLNHLKKFNLDADNPLSYYIDSYQLMQYLNIKSRTLQHWRSKKIIPYIRIAGKIWYNLFEVMYALDQHTIGTTSSFTTLYNQKGQSTPY